MSSFLFIAVVISNLAYAQEDSQELAFNFKKGQTIRYQVHQETSAFDSMGEFSSSVKNKTRVTKEWKIIETDINNVTTIEMRVIALLIETTMPNGELLKFNSELPDGPLKDSLLPIVGTVVAKLKVDSLGRVLEVIQCKFGKPSRFETEPPFAAVLHGQKIIPGQTWQRKYFATLEPPIGTGEKIGLVQNYIAKSVNKQIVTLNLETVSEKPFKNSVEEASILQMMPKGTLIFDKQKGLLKSADLSIDTEIKDVSGPGSSYRFQSIYRESLLD